MRSMLRISLLLSLATYLVLGAGLRANAEERAIVRGVLCDEEAQMLRFMEGWRNDPDNTLELIRTINQEAGVRTACWPNEYAIVIVERKEAEKFPTGEWQISKVIVHGVRGPMGIVRVQPFENWGALSPEPQVLRGSSI